ncbi:MAG: flagellar biosynthetic protein FliR [Bdellovibrionaceae bacterium]|nr:flagellar biosynthetic protein FliR [Pseudobdellovibrionaceae bacterium]
MFPSFAMNENEILAFALALIRIISFLVSWPVFSVYSVPNQAKVLLAVLLTMLMFPTIGREELAGVNLGHEILWLAGKEAAVGVSLGFVTRMLFFAFGIAGNLMSTYVGLSSAQVFNPSLGMQATTLEQFYLTVATLVFLALNGHHIFLEGLAQSFQSIPLSMQGVNLSAFTQMTDFVSDVVVAGIQISAPIMVTIFILNIFMGILGRTVPQINVLVTSLPVNILAGIGVMILSLPVLVPETEAIMNSMAEHLFLMLKTL